MSKSVIGIDARMINASGIGTYLQGLLYGLERKPFSNYSLTLFVHPSSLPAGPWSIRPVSARIYSVTEQVMMPWAVHASQTTLLHAPHYNIPYLVAKNTIVTVHDLIHLKFPQFWPSLAARAYAQFFFHRVVPKARAILTVSENTQRDLVDMLGIPENRITVTYPGVFHERLQNIPPTDMAEFERLGFSRPYLLYVGNLKPFKNVERLVEVYKRLSAMRKDFPELVIVGRNFIPGFDRQMAHSSGIRWVGEIKGTLLPCLYKKALALVFPSLYEGFGLPPLEAMAAGTPVICSNRASLPEVVGDAALLINPEDPEDMQSAIMRLVEDSSLRQDLSVKGLAQAARFTWDRMAEQTMRVYEQCLH